jgi:hypothetical protein
LWFNGDIMIYNGIMMIYPLVSSNVASWKILSNVETFHCHVWLPDGVYIYIYTRNAWAFPIHKQMMLQITVTPMGKKTKVLRTIKQTRSKHPKFLWEKQKRHNIWNSLYMLHIILKLPYRSLVGFFKIPKVLYTYIHYFEEFCSRYAPLLLFPLSTNYPTGS